MYGHPDPAACTLDRILFPPKIEICYVLYGIEGDSDASTMVKTAHPQVDAENIHSSHPNWSAKNTQYEMSQSTSHSTTSTVPLRAPLNAPKDFQSNPQSQSTYGLSGITPSPVEKVTTTVPTPTTAPPQATNKNSQYACADLQPTGGGVSTDLLIDTADAAFSSVFHSERHPEGETRTKTKVRTVPRPTQHMVAL
ncbi:hypothetical protein B0H14DRAFT_3882048 [Mycena olivaceomarginata]|nr:hypothetical protein B0H14DRAFT_3882048 [Mycena olivaceomarginata]